jgi:predicted GTPase
MGKTISDKPLKSHEKINSYLFCGETGSGKSFTANEILHDKLKHIPEDNRFLVSPTFKFDKTLKGYFT